MGLACDFGTYQDRLKAWMLTDHGNKPYGKPAVVLFMNTKEGSKLKDTDAGAKSLRVVDQKAFNAKREFLAEKYKDLLGRKEYLFRQYNVDGLAFAEVNNEVVNEIESLQKQQLIIDELFTVDSLKERQAHLLASGFIKKLSAAFNTPYVVVSETEAQGIVEANSVVYNGEPGFYSGGIIYLVEGKSNLNTVLHEFGHVLIKGIRHQNPELFNSLKNSLLSTRQGLEMVEMIAANYPELKGDENLIIEEALTTVLEQHSMKELDKIEKEDPEFANFIRNLIAYLRKLFRKVMPKTKVEKIDTNTTLEQLAKLMVREDVYVNMPKDIVETGIQFSKEILAADRKLAETLGTEKLTNIVNTTYAEITEQLNNLKNTPYVLAQELKKNRAEQLLRAIKSQLEPYQSVTKVSDGELLDATQKHYDEMYNRLIALMSTLNNINHFVKNIETALKSLEDGGVETTLGIQQVMYYENYLAKQLELIDELKTEAKLPRGNDFISTLDDIQNNIVANQKRSQKLKLQFVNAFFSKQSERVAPAVVTLLNDRLGPILDRNNFTADQKSEILNKIMTLEKDQNYKLSDFGLQNLPTYQQKEALDTIKEYMLKRLDDSTIEDFVTGRRGDIDFFQAYIVPMSNIDDPLIGSTVMWMRKLVSDAEQETLRMADKFADTIIDSLKALNYNPNDTTQLAKLLLVKDTVGRYHEGKFNKTEIYSFIDTHINWRGDLEELNNNFEEAKATGDPEKIKKAYWERETWKKNYLYQPYTKPYRDLQNIWDQDNTVVNPFTNESLNVSRDLSQEAKVEKTKAYAVLNLHSSKSFQESEENIDHTTEEQARKDYNQLFSIYNPDGSEKTGDELKKVLVRLKYRNEAGNFYEYMPMTGRLQEDFDSFINKLAGEGITKEENPEEYDKQLKTFEKRFMKKSYSDEYYKDMKEIMGIIKEVSSKYADQYPQLQEKALLMDERYSIISKDAFGTPNGTALTPEQTERILEIDKKIDAITKSVDLASGLSKEEHARLKTLSYKFATKRSTMTAEELAEMQTLSDKSRIQGMTPEDNILYAETFKRFFELSSKEPTDYYFDAFLYAIGDVEVEPITPETANDYINNEEIIKKAAEENPRFKEWFLKNHYQVERYEKGELVKRWVRTSQWNMSVPNDKTHIATTTLRNSLTNEEVTLQGVPNNKYTFARVKNEFMTVPFGKEKEFVGKYIDNQGNYLPRPYKPGDPESAVDDKYINKEYEQIKKAGGARWNLLQAFKAQALIQQEGIPNSMKLYYDLPRFGLRKNLELAQRGAVKEKFETTKEAIMNLNWIGKKGLPADAAELGFNAQLERKLVSTDLRGNQTSHVHVRGLSDLSTAETSVDVLSSFYDYMYSVNLAKTKVKNEAIGKAIMEVMDNPDNAIKDMEKVSKQAFQVTKSLKYLKTGDNKRADTMRYLMDKFFYGNEYSNFESQNPVITRVANMMMGAASRSFIALDVPSAMKNRWGMIFQSHIEAAGGKYMDFQSLAKGRIRSAKNIWELSTKGIYKINDKPMDVSIMEYFDAVAGKTGKDFSKNASRSMLKDFFDMTWLYDFRKLAEVEASLQVFWGMMYKKEVPQKMPDGTVKMIKYAEAWTKDENGKVKLKEGINPEYGNEFIDHTVTEGETLQSIADKYNIPVENLAKKNNMSVTDTVEAGKKLSISQNEEFSNFKFKVQGVNKRLNGLMDSLDNPQAERFLGYRLFTFYKKFATGMFLNRFQSDMDKDNRFGHTWDYEMAEMNRGWMVDVIAATGKFVKTGGKYYHIMRPEEKQAFQRALAEGVQLLMIVAAVSLLFGYDMGDEDRFKKIRKREEDYGALGWMSNHLLYQLMMVKQENEAFTTYLGLNQMITYGDKTSIAFGPTINLYGKILYDLGYMLTGSEKARYKADAGPYPWQKEGNYKLWQHLFSTLGVKGKTYDPAHAIKMAEMFENLR